ncbi:DUF5977 domain-containing protein [Mucilaginibacter sp. NFX135]|uniref:DUF5977 domain-containing protein n=1 Tax=Mucilaginibacter sp. NFX135 TaxID=3402687 RepID=UPI003AFB4B29
MKPKLSGLFILVMLLCLLTNLVKAQATGDNYFLPNVFPKSPNSAAAIKYGDYKVNLFTGVPDISIPLYTIQSGGLEMPVTLSYHASGFKVSDVASWVGLGWSVSTGGSINRKIMGLPDEEGTGFLQPGMWKSSLDINSVNADIDYAANVLFIPYDSQPDIYSYNFPGHNGNFFFEGSNGLKPALLPFAPISITHTTPTNQNYYRLNFTILDEHGNNYGFGNAFEQTSGISSGHTTISTTGWMLDNVISQDRRDTISLSYQPQPITYPAEAWQEDLVEDLVINTGAGSPFTTKYTPHFNNGTVQNSVGEQDLNTILFKNGKVVFDLETANRQDQQPGNNTHPLQAIRVMAYNFSTKTYQLQKKIVFYKSYFSPTRLRLDSIQIQDAGGATMEHYRFTYNTSIAMPPGGTFAKDYWGYYNGKNNSTSLIPQFTFTANDGQGHTINYNIGQPNPAINPRISDSTYMQAGILTSIYFPTGGHTDFTYQTNRYTDESNNLALAGGLRIASIKSYDGVNPTPIIKTYQYNKARANFLLDFSYFVNSSTHEYWGSANSGVTSGKSGSERYTAIVSNPSVDPTPFDQALVVYPSVTEYIGTPGTNVGRSDYYFRDIGDNRQTSIGGTPIIQSNFYGRGQLLSKTDYLHKSDGTYQIVKKDSSTYTAFPFNRHETAGWVITEAAWAYGPGAPGIAHYDAASGFNPNAINQFIVQNYSITSDDNYVTSNTTYLYDQTDPSKYTTSAVTYKYDNIKHQQVSRSYHTDSKGNINITTNKYPADYAPGNMTLDSMLNRNMQAELVEKWDSVKNVTTGVNGIVAGQLNLFKGTGNGGNPIVPDRIKKLRVSTPLTNFVPSSVVSGNLQNDSRYTQMISLDQYDFHNNLIQYTPRNSTPSFVIWDYNNANPVAQIKNASVSNAAYTSFESGGKGGWVYSGIPVGDPTAPTGNNVYPLSSGAISPYYIDNGKNYILSYWSNNGAATVFAGSFIDGTALRSDNGWTYYEHRIPAGFSVGPSVSGSSSIDELAMYPADAQITTYTYDPNGLKNIADTKGMTSNFDYDFFQRLKNVKDWQGNIVKNYGYHNYDMTIPNDAISSPAIARNNCPSGTIPTSTNYSVPANKYYSSTKASANAEAQYDHDVNGQIYANQVCSCNVQMIPFTLINSTGLSGFQATFRGTTTITYNFPSSGSTVVQVPAGTYDVQFPPLAPFDPHTWSIGNRTPVTAPSTTFTGILISASSSDSSAKVQ